MGGISSTCRDWAQLGDTKPRPEGKKYTRWLGVRGRATLYAAGTTLNSVDTWNNMALREGQAIQFTYRVR